MVQETNFKRKIVYKCMKCGWMYKDEDLAKKCEDWCRRHNSCSLEMAKYAIKV